MLNSSAELFQVLENRFQEQCAHDQVQRQKGRCMPNWKYSANWLAQRCWEDEINHAEEIANEYAKQADPFWSACDNEIENDTSKEAENNIVQFEECC